MTFREPTNREVRYADAMAHAAARIYSEIADWYVDSFFDDPSDADWLDQFCKGLPPAGLVLDAGAGPGNFSKFLLARGLRPVSSDIAVGMVAMSRRLVPNVPTVISDMRHVPARTAAFDGLLCAYSLMHVPEPLEEAVLAEFARVLKDGGVLQLMVKLGDSPYAFRARGVDGVTGHVQLFKQVALIQQLERLGLHAYVQRIKRPTSPAEFDHPKLMVLARRQRANVPVRSR